MRRTTANSLPSDDLSLTDTGSNLFDIDVDQALHEFCIPSTQFATESDPLDGTGPGEDVLMSSRPDEGGGRATVELEGCHEGALSAESSDPDVIHIDLTQRPPPLPMSGLALEQIVSILPGSTYAVSGSGIPMRTSPRCEPRQQPPAANTSPSPSCPPGARRPSAAGAAAFRSAAEDSLQNTADDPPETQDTPSRQRAEPEGGAGHSPAGAGGSPRMTLTFIPGLGLVPVVIHDMMEGDDDDGGLRYEGGVIEGLGGEGVQATDIGLRVIVKEHHDNDQVDAVMSPLAIDPISDDSFDVDAGGVGVEAVAAALEIGGSSDFESDALLQPGSTSGGEAGSPPDAADAMGRRASAEPPPLADGAGAAVPKGPYDISEQQLRDIIEQAVHGLAFDQIDLDGVLGEDSADEDRRGPEDKAGLIEESEGGSGSGSPLGSPTARDGMQEAAQARRSAGHPIIEMLYGSQPLKAPPIQADGSAPDGAAACGEDFYDDDFESSGGPDTPDDDGDQEDEGEEEVADDVEEEDEEYCADEVDDSGSGGTGEPDRILGGLQRPRFVYASENPALVAIHPESGPARALASVPLAAAAGSSSRSAPESQPLTGGADQNAAQEVAAAPRQQSNGSATALPRPRYMSYNFMAAYDPPRWAQPAAEPVESGGAPTAPGPGEDECEIKRPDAAAAAAAATAGGSASGAVASATPAAAVGPTAATANSTASNNGFSALFSTPFAGGVFSGSSSGGGSDLNFTMRTTGQSLSAIRQAALKAEAQRQAKTMAERLGGGGDDRSKSIASNGPSGVYHHKGISSHAPGPVSRSGVAHIVSPFGLAGHEASAAAGLTEARSHQDSGSGLNRTIRRSGAAGVSSSLGPSLTGLDGERPPWSHSAGWKGDHEEGAGDILRDRAVIQPRYPTDAKPDQHPHGHRHDHPGHGHRQEETAQPEAKDVSGGKALFWAADDSGHGWRPRHRRSIDLVDLDKITAGGTDQGQAAVTSPAESSGSNAGSGGASSPRSPPARSLLATRKSDDGVLAAPMPSSSPRMDDDDGSASMSSSSSAHSVADEKLVDELEALREELSLKTTLVAGLRGELRKYTELAMRLEHQLGELRSQVGEEGPDGAKGRNRSRSDTGAVGRQGGTAVAPVLPATAAPATPGQDQPAEAPLSSPEDSSAKVQPGQQAPGSAPPPLLPAAPGLRATEGVLPAVNGATCPAPSAPAAPASGAGHHLPPHPQAEGLEATARLALYNKVLSLAQDEVTRCGGPAPPDLRDALELLLGKEKLDAGTEKVMLFKVQKMVTWGCEAAWKASMVQQQARHAEQVFGKARSAWEVEREQLKQALEAERVRTLSASSPAASAGAGQAKEGDGPKELRQQLEAAKVQLAAAQQQVSDLDSVVASLNADVRKLRAQLRSSRDGSKSQPQAEPPAAAPSPADSMAWSMERQMLLSTISALEQQIKEAQAAAEGPAESGPPRRLRCSKGAEGDEAGEGAIASLTDGPTPWDRARVWQLEEERDAAAAANTELLQQLQELQAALAVAGGVGSPEPKVGANGGMGADCSSREVGGAADVEQQRLELEDLQRELEAARQALQRRTAEAQAEHEEQCDVLRAQVVELRRELAATSADAVAAVGRLEEEKRALQAAGVDAAGQEARARRLQEDLLAAEVELRSLRLELNQQLAAKGELEAQLGRLRAAADPGKDAEPVNLDVPERIKVLSAGEDAAATIETLSQALKSEARERQRLQQLLGNTSRDLAHAEAQLRDVRPAIAQLQEEAAQTHSQAAQLHGVLAQVRRERDEAEAAADEARAAMVAAEERAADARAACLLAETALQRVEEETAVLRLRVASLEDEAAMACQEAAAAQTRAEAAVAKAQKEVGDLRAYAAAMETEARDLRTALAAEDKLQLQLRDQVACLESELEAQASVAHVRGQRAAEVEAALASVEEQGAAAGGVASSCAESAEPAVVMARAEAQAAKQRAEEAEARVAEAQRCLSGALQRCEQAVQQGIELHQRLTEVDAQRQRAEQQLQEAVAEVAELRHWRQGKLLRQSAAVARLVALEERLRGAELDREALQQEVSELLAQLVPSTPRSSQLTAASMPQAASVTHLQRGGNPSAGGATAGTPSRRSTDASSTAAAPAAPKASLVADLSRLQTELERLRNAAVEAGSRSGSLGGASEAGGSAKGAVVSAASMKRAQVLEEQLRSGQAEAQALRADLQAARVELVVKDELLAAKDRSLATLQETMDALKVALQVTQQATSTLSPRDSGWPGGAEPPDERIAAAQLQRYRGTVAQLQSKFEGSESTIRRLQRQVAALETRFVPDGSRLTGGDGQPEEAKIAVEDWRLQLQGKEEEVRRLRRELEQLRGLTQAPASARAGPPASGTSPRSPGTDGSIDVGGASVGAATVSELQIQVMQWRALSEDVHARYQSKKEAVRRLREQLASEQQRHADEQARGQSQLEAARQRLGRLATDLGTAIRRCIAMDLQPLSATTLTTSPRSPLGGGDVPDEISALAALLARQGTALVESLETALDQVTSAREERALLMAQLAHRQAVLDELRHHLVRQASPPSSGADAAAASARGGATGAASPSGGWAGSGLQQRSSFSPTKPGDARTVLFTTGAASVGSLHMTTAVTAVSPTAAPPSIAATDDTSMAAAAATTPPKLAPPISPTKSLQTAALSLAQDMAALSVQQAGLRSTLHQFEQRQAQQQQQQAARPRSLGAVPFVPGSSAYSGAAVLGTYANGASGLRTVPRAGSAGSWVDSLSYNSTGTAGPHSFVGILSGSRPDAASGGVGGLHINHRPLTGLYQQQTTSPGMAPALQASVSYDGGRLQDGVAPLLSASSIPAYARTTGVSALGVGASATATAAAAAGPSSVLSLSNERRLRLGEGSGSSAV